jgi:transcription elongation factor GreA
MVVTFKFEGDDDDEAITFLLLGAREVEPEGLKVYTPQSPLGEAINGRKKGETVTYEANGKPQTVVILDAKPYTG